MWISGNASHLLYFVMQLMEGGFVTEENPMNYKRLQACFIKSNGERFTENFKQMKNDIIKKDKVGKEFKEFIRGLLTELKKA